MKKFSVKSLGSESEANLGCMDDFRDHVENSRSSLLSAESVISTVKLIPLFFMPHSLIVSLSFLLAVQFQTSDRILDLLPGNKLAFTIATQMHLKLLRQQNSFASSNAFVIPLWLE